MTDAVIENALAQQPKEIRDISAAKIQTLKDRRNFIVADVMEYYLLAENRKHYRQRQKRTI